MPSKPDKPLAPELLKILRAIAHTDLATLSTIAHHAGSNTHGLLMTLRERGYLSEHVGRQRNGSPTTMYSVSVKGKDALKKSEDESNCTPGIEPVPALAAAPIAPSGGVYGGSEMRPYTGRPGAMDAFKFPSRVGDRLHHRDGSVTSVSRTR